MRLRVAFSSVVGGDPVTVDTQPVGADAGFMAELNKQLGSLLGKRSGEASFSVRGGGGEGRVVVLSRDKLKVRKKGRVGSDQTLLKAEFSAGLSLAMDPFDDVRFEVRARRCAGYAHAWWSIPCAAQRRPDVAESTDATMTSSPMVRPVWARDSSRASVPSAAL